MKQFRCHVSVGPVPSGAPCQAVAARSLMVNVRCTMMDLLHCNLNGLLSLGE